MGLDDVMATSHLHEFFAGSLHKCNAFHPRYLDKSMIIEMFTTAVLSLLTVFYLNFYHRRPESDFHRI